MDIFMIIMFYDLPHPLLKGGEFPSPDRRGVRGEVKNYNITQIQIQLNL